MFSKYCLKDGQSILHYICFLGYQGLAEYILQHIVETGIAQQLFNAQDQDGMTALHYAAFHGHIALVALLLKKNDLMDCTLMDKVRSTTKPCFAH